MSIAPIQKQINVKLAPARAFELFVTEMACWWPTTHSIAQKPRVAIVLEPHPGGKWFERDAEGTETPWRKVLVWEPPTRLVLAWQIGSDWAYNPDLVTEVELSFAAIESGGTLISLEHRDLERYGADAGKMAGQLGGGWPKVLGDFADFAGGQ